MDVMIRILRTILFLLLPASILAGCSAMALDGEIGQSDRNYANDGSKGDKNSNKSNDGSYYLVSLRQRSDSLYLVLSGGDQAYITNPDILKGVYQGETMATASFQVLRDGKKPFKWEVRLNWVIPLAVQDILPTYPSSSKAPSASDPVTVLTGPNSLSCAFDGYLTIQYRIDASGQKQHSFSLVPDPAGKGPYDFLLLHDRQGDPSGNEVTGLVAFRLDGLLKQAAKEMTLRVRNTDLQGKEQITSFEYRFTK